MKKLNFSFALLAIILGCMMAPQSLAQQDKAAASLLKIMEEYKVPGMSVAVVKNNDIIYSQSFGLKNIEKEIPLSNDDIFRIASISKSFTATGLMQMAEKKKLSLDDDFGKLVGFTIRNPKFPDKVITLKMVLSHTSSINDSQGYFNLDVINPDKNPNWEKCYNDYEPGSTYRYCNLNFNMAGTVLEKISGERFDQYVKKHVLDPLKLNGGYWVDALDSTRFVTLYEYDSAANKYTPSPSAYAPRREEIKNYVMGYSTPIFSPTGGMKMSATDLAKYMAMHMNDGKYKGKRILSKKSVRLMQEKISDKINYGLAISTTDRLIEGKTMKGHTGSAYGLYSAMFFHPEEKFGIVVIVNSCNPTSTNGSTDVLRVTVNSLYDNLVK